MNPSLKTKLIVISSFRKIPKVDHKFKRGNIKVVNSLSAEKNFYGKLAENFRFCITERSFRPIPSSSLLQNHCRILQPWNIHKSVIQVSLSGNTSPNESYFPPHNILYSRLPCGEVIFTYYRMEMLSARNYQVLLLSTRQQVWAIRFRSSPGRQT